MSKKQHIEVKAGTDSFGRAQEFVEGILHSRKVNANMASETMLLFEAVFHSIAAQAEESTTLELSRETAFGKTIIKICYEGARFSIPEEDVSTDPEAKIMEVLSDKLSCSYHTGSNVIKITVHHSSFSVMLPNIAAIVLAVIAYIVISCFLDHDAQVSLSQNWITPLEKLFTNAILMIGAPMTLFSLLKNATDSFIVAERHSASRKLFLTSLATSIMAIIIAIVYGGAVGNWLLSASGTTESYELGFSGWSLATAVDQILPSNILEPFQTISPIPMIIVAVLVTYALCSVGSSFDPLKRAIDVCYDLFSRILNIVMAFFPLACFLLILGMMIENGVWDAAAILLLIPIVFTGTAILFATYAIRLRAHGVKVADFVNKIKPLVKENLAIGSAIDAVPYNVRYCAKHFGFSRMRLEKELPVLAQTNLDGNCFILMLMAMLYITVSNTEVSWLNIAVIGVIVLFLSFGAPNQPGSILIGMMIVFAYLNVEDTVSLALFFELFCGALQNIINVINGVVTIAESEDKA